MINSMENFNPNLVFPLKSLLLANEKKRPKYNFRISVISKKRGEDIGKYD